MNSKTPPNQRYVYSFSDNKEGNTKEMRMLLGNKGAQLAEMTSIGLRVPPGFTITTRACMDFLKNKEKWPQGMEKQVRENLAALEKKMGMKFGDPENPLLVSVRYGSYISMPGMMDSILNTGLNDETVEGFAKNTNNPRVAWDSYRRFIHMFGDVVMGVPYSKFEEAIRKMKETKGFENDSNLSVGDLKKLVQDYKKIVEKHTGQKFPMNPWDQMKMGIDAIFKSWFNPKAIAFRKINKINNDFGTAVNVQAMVFGNMGDTSGTGVTFTRNPSTGAKEKYGEFLINAQGEDVVAGTRTPKPIEAMKKLIPTAYADLIKVYKILENHYKDMQDIEFTIQKGKLYLLQTRTAKRTAQAAVKIAIDMVKEGIIKKEEALLHVNPTQLDQIMHKQLDSLAKKKADFIAKGLAASSGAIVGQAVFTPKRAAELKAENPEASLILVRKETSPDDIEGMNAAAGILTAVGGLTSHAAVVARGMGKCCVVGCADIHVDEENANFSTLTMEIKENDWITIDGSTGEVFDGQLPIVEPKLGKDFKTLMSWADSFRKLKVRTNADAQKDSQTALNFGAEGIGLTRTEHMFFEGERIKVVREMILAESGEGRKAALAKLLPMQRADFEAIFEVMNSRPVTIRLLDPPLHEFLPYQKKDVEALAEQMGVPKERLQKKVNSLCEQNPMLGHRGCRLGLTYPEINEMQARAIFEAALNVKKKGIKPKPEIEVPLVGMYTELKEARAIIERVAEETGAKGKINYKIGTMIELPRACLTADEISAHADFLSFGTNDLTQTTYGLSRDDVCKFVSVYIEKGIMETDPFHTIDRAGVGELMKICVSKARTLKPNIEIGICGEHGGEPASVEFCHEIGLDYVSCSPYRVPIARLAAAHAAIKEKKKQ